MVRESSVHVYKPRPFKSTLKLGRAWVHHHRPHQDRTVYSLPCMLGSRSCRSIIWLIRYYVKWNFDQEKLFFAAVVVADVAWPCDEIGPQLLLSMVSSFRYDGEEVDEKIAKSEADQLHDAIERQKLDQDHILWILSTRNQCQLNATFNIYKQDYGNPIDKVLWILSYFNRGGNMLGQVGLDSAQINFEYWLSTYLSISH